MKTQNKLYIAIGIAVLASIFLVLSLFFQPKPKTSKIISNTEKNISKNISASEKTIKQDLNKSKNFFVKLLNRGKNFINVITNTTAKKTVTYSILSLLLLLSTAFIFNHYSFVDFYVFNTYNQLFLNRVNKELAKTIVTLTQSNISAAQISKSKNRLESYSRSLNELVKAAQNTEIKQSALALISTINKLLLNKSYTQA